MNDDDRTGHGMVAVLGATGGSGSELCGPGVGGVMARNLTSAFHVEREAATWMRENGGAVGLLSSRAGLPGRCSAWMAA